MYGGRTYGCIADRGDNDMLIHYSLSIALTLMQPPSQNQEPVLSKLTVQPLKQIGDICDVAVKRGGSEDEPIVVVLGMLGFTTGQLDRLPAIHCDEPTAFAAAMNGRIVEDNGRLWFLRGHEHWATAAELYDESGQLVWRVPPDPKSPDWKDASGVEFVIPLRTPDGLVFAIGFNGTDTIAMILPGNAEPLRYRWKRTGSQAFAWDIDGDGADEIAYPTGEGLVVRRVDSTVVTTIAPTKSGYLNDVFPTRFPGRDGGPAVCIGYFDKKADRQRYEIFSPKGELLDSVDRPAPYRPATELGVSGYYIRTEEIATQGNQVVGIETNRLHLSMYHDRELISSIWIDAGGNGRTRVSGGMALFEHDGERGAIIGFGARLFVYRIALPPQADP